MIPRLMLVMLLAIFVAGCGATPEQATSVRVESDPPDEMLGWVVVTVNGTERRIAGEAWDAWLIQDGRAVVYSSVDGAGGYEDEGQSLWRYDVAERRHDKLMTEIYMIEDVDEATSQDGRTVLLVSMRDGGLGAPHVAVVDPVRGQVWRQDTAEFLEVMDGEVVVADYEPEEWAIDLEEAEPREIIRHNLDALLNREAHPDSPIGVEQPSPEFWTPREPPPQREQ